MERRPATEISVSLLIIVICAVFWLQASRLPPGTFEPLGSGPMPMWTAAIVAVCGLIVIMRNIRYLRRPDTPPASLRAEFAGGTPRPGLIMIAASIVYVALLHVQAASFGVLTFIFLTALISAMDGLRLRRLPAAAIVAAIAAFGSEYLFTEVFVVDLPA